MSESQGLSIEEPPTKKARKLVKKKFDSIDEDEVLDLNGQGTQDDDEIGDDDIDRDDMNEDEEDNEIHHQYRFMGRANPGFDVSAHDLREAQEIFGEDLDELDEDVDESGEKIDETVVSRPNFEYFQQVKSFSLTRDEEIRNSDTPERFHFIFDGIKNTQVNYDIEAVWVVRKMYDQAMLNRKEFSDLKSQEFMKSIPIILPMIHVCTLSTLLSISTIIGSFLCSYRRMD